MGMKTTSVLLTAFLLILNGATVRAQLDLDRPVRAFVDVSLVPMTSTDVIPHQTVVVRGNRIESIAPAEKATIPEGAVRIDGKGKFLMPGFGEMHGHNP